LAHDWSYAKGNYNNDGKPTKELSGMKYAIKPVRRLYGILPVCDFGPLALKAVRQAMIESDLCRTQINARINRIRRVFRWAVSEELVPPSVYEALRTVQGLRFGRTEARESEPVRPVPDDASTGACRSSYSGTQRPGRGFVPAELPSSNRAHNRPNRVQALRRDQWYGE
jgi:hypothetical protein